MRYGFEDVILDGKAQVKGTIPVPVIGANGNWYIGNNDTGVHAQGSTGEKGDTGLQGLKGEQGAIGPQGPKGDKGEIDVINDQTPTYTVASELSELTSGENVSTAFGKLTKAVSLFIVHIAGRATDSIMGHVKLSNSPLVSETGTYALDAVEKNAEVVGTMANQIAKQSVNLNNKIKFTSYFGITTETDNTIPFTVSKTTIALIFPAWYKNNGFIYKFGVQIIPAGSQTFKINGANNDGSLLSENVIFDVYALFTTLE